MTRTERVRSEIRERLTSAGWTAHIKERTDGKSYDVYSRNGHNGKVDLKETSKSIPTTS